MAKGEAKTSGGKRGGWKRGARPGKYTSMQRNIACRVTVMGMPNGKAAYESPAICPVVIQARISLGDLPRGTCGVTYAKSPCNEVGK